MESFKRKGTDTSLRTLDPVEVTTLPIKRRARKQAEEKPVYGHFNPLLTKQLVSHPKLELVKNAKVYSFNADYAEALELERLEVQVAKYVPNVNVTTDDWDWNRLKSGKRGKVYTLVEIKAKFYRDGVTIPPQLRSKAKKDDYIEYMNTNRNMFS